MEQGDANKQAPQGQPQGQQPPAQPQGAQGGGEQKQPQAQPQQPPAQKKPVQLSQTAQRMQDMLRRERQLQEQEKKLTERESKVKEAEELAQVARTKPLDFLKKQGISYSDLTKQVINGPGPDPTEELQKELQQLKQEVTETKKQAEERKRQEALQEAQTAVQQTIEQAEGYDLIKATDSYDQVFQTIIEHYEQTGEVLSENDAAAKVEENLSSTVDRLLQLDVIKKRLGGAGSEEAPQAKPTGMGTLDNAASAQRPSAAGNLDELSEEESIAKLAEMLQKGQLPTE